MARKHLVICYQCGKQFDANKGAYYNASMKRYACTKCGRALKKSNTQSMTKSGQSTGAMIAKVVIGVLFIITAFSSPEGGWTIGYFLTGLIIGCGLILWGIYPHLKVKKDALDAKKQHETLVAEELARPKLCSSCGATGTGNVCEYCGTKYNT